MLFANPIESFNSADNWPWLVVEVLGGPGKKPQPTVDCKLILHAQSQTELHICRAWVTGATLRVASHI